MMSVTRCIVLLALVAAPMGGCISVPQSAFEGGRATPLTQLEQLVRERKVALGQTPVLEVCKLLVPEGEASSRAWRTNPSLYEDPGHSRFAVLYAEPVRMYGITLMQHFFYLPMPMFGVRGDQPVAVFLSFDKERRLTGWRRARSYDFSALEEHPGRGGEMKDSSTPSPDKRKTVEGLERG